MVRALTGMDLRVPEAHIAEEKSNAIGGVVNASVLARLGIVINWTKDKVKALVRLLRYLDFLAAVGKNTFDAANVVVASQEQFKQTIDAAL